MEGKKKEGGSENEAERREMSKPTNVQKCPKNLKPLMKNGGVRCSGQHRRNSKMCKHYNEKTGECDYEGAGGLI